MFACGAREEHYLALYLLQNATPFSPDISMPVNRLLLGQTRKKYCMVQSRVLFKYFYYKYVRHY
jgi:hypothetical protein